MAERQERRLSLASLVGIASRTVFRVITTYRNGGERPVIEKGPWHPSRPHTEYWAEQLRLAGYAVEIESQGGAIKEDNSDLAAALASMA